MNALQPSSKGRAGKLTKWGSKRLVKIRNKAIKPLLTQKIMMSFNQGNKAKKMQIKLGKKVKKTMNLHLTPLRLDLTIFTC